MNEHEEQRFAQSVHRVLEASAQRLPYRVTMRLEKSRNAALQRMPGAAAKPTRPQGAAAAAFALSADGTATIGPGGEGELPRWLRAAVSIVPILAVAAGLALIADWVDADRASEIAEVDVAVLVDELPISAYADRGFGVFLKNTYQQ